MARQAPETMFDREVVDEMRRQFDAADTDGSGELDADEACKAFAKNCSVGATDDDVSKTTENLRRQVDADSSGKISFDEYCFRFGRRMQMEIARKRRSGTDRGLAAPNASSEAPAGDDPAEQLRRERDALKREREALRKEREELHRESEMRNRRQTVSVVVGARVRIHGIQKLPELNGRTAKVLRFDEQSGRHVVELEGGGGQKSLREENLLVCTEQSHEGSSGRGTPNRSTPTGSTNSGGTSRHGNISGPSFGEKCRAAVLDVVLRVRMWLAGYEVWQLVLGLAILGVFFMAWLELQQRYAVDPPRTRPATDQNGYDSYFGDKTQYPYSSTPDDYSDTFAERSYEDQYPRHENGYPRHRSDEFRSEYDAYDDDFPRRPSRRPNSANRYRQSEGSSGWGLDWNSLYMYAVMGGLGYACWTGIIPVHRMSWMQLYFLWNIVQGLLGGRRGGMRGMGGLGGGMFGGGLGRRRGFFY
mmetsp:Transcript_46221/g.122519  ORF Transcript_46221/g.122519 Transcript_46221/m.122519 type:complete len:474 (-) Transcript_46221:8-1429(-)